MKKIPVYFIALILAACNNSADTTSGTNDSSKDVETSAGNSDAQPQYSGCYRQVVGRDTILLQLDQENGLFTGRMAFDNYEKDASHGTVKGHLENGNIVLWYDFSSEGMQSVMEVILKPGSSGLIRAEGEVVSRGDSAMLHHESLHFDPSNTMVRFDCSGWH